MPVNSKKAVTLNDVALAAGVSKSTASQALNRSSGRYGVTPGKREAILDIARELGFMPNPNAIRLAKGNASNQIAIYSPSLDPGVTIFKVQHIQTLLAERGFDTQLHAHPYHGRTVTNPGAVLRSLRFERPRGILCNAGWVITDEELEELDQYIADGGALVCMTFRSNKLLACDHVQFDEENSIRIAVEYLVSLGHRKIGCATHDIELVNHNGTAATFLHAAKDHGLEGCARWIFDARMQYYEEAGAAFAAKFLIAEDRPTAMIVGNDVAASVFVNTVMRAGVRVPGDVSIVGLDDSPASCHAIVPLTAVSQPYRLHGEVGVRMILERISGDFLGAPRTETVVGTLKVRESTHHI